MRCDEDDPNPLQQRDDHNTDYGQAEPAGHNAEREHRAHNHARPQQRVSVSRCESWGLFLGRRSLGEWNEE